MSEWISVEERLPEYGLRVLAAYDDGVVRISYSKGYFPNVVTKRPDSKAFGFADVTHWMPLPEPPVDIAELATTTATVSETERVRCADCKHLMFSDCYGECGAGHRGIVRPDDTCPYGDRRADDEQHH